MSTRLEVDERVAAPLDAVQAAVVDPAFYRRLGELPTISTPQVVDRRAEDGVVHLQVRYAFTGRLPAAALKVIDPARLTWLDRSTVDLRAHRTTFEMVPDHYPDTLHVEGAYDLVADGEGTLQRFRARVAVRYPVVGRLVERGIARGFEENLAAQGRLLERFTLGR